MTQPDDQKNQSQHGDLGSELRELGQQLEQAVRSALESDRARQVQADIASGMKEIGAQLQTAMKAIQDNPRVQHFVQRGEQAVDQAQHSKAAQDLQDSLARGIAMLNEQLSGFVTRLNQEGTTPPSSSATPSSSSGATTDTSSSPATGETTRLDPDGN